MNCDQIRAMYLAGEEDAITSAHMAECPACRSVRADLDAGRTALVDSVVWEEPSPELENQVVALISGNRTVAGVSRGRLARWLGPVAAVAAVIVAVALFAVVRSPSPD